MPFEDWDEVYGTIEDRYPLLIGRTLRKFRQLHFEKSSAQLKQLIEIWEVSLRYLAAIVCRTYLVTDGGSPEINGIIRNFRSPSNGHWIELLRECSKQLQERATLKMTPGDTAFDSGPLELSSRIAEFLFKPLNGKRNHPTFKTAESLIALQNSLSIDIAPTNLSFFDLISKIRNNWIGHSASRTENEYDSIVKYFAPIIFHVLQDLEFLTQFPLYFVKEVRVDKGSFDHQIDLCMGRDFEIGKFSLAETPLNNKELYLFQLTDSTGPEPEVNWALSLSPYLIVEECKECHQKQIFIFNRLSGKKLEFMSYVCGHNFVPPGHLGDLEDIFGFLDGTKDIRSLLKGKALGKFFSEENLAVSPETRQNAQCKVNDGKQHIVEEQFILAAKSFQEAVDLDPDNAEANFLLGMIQILSMESLPTIISNVRRALELDPENSRYCLTLAQILLGVKQHEEAVDFLHRTIVIDPANQEAKNLLSSIDAATDTEGAKSHEES